MIPASINHHFLNLGGIPADYVARYLFDGDFTDESGTYNGTNSGSSFVGSGNGPGGTSFGISTGAGNFVSLPISLVSALGSSSGTVSCAVKTSASTNVARIINASDTGTIENFCVFNYGQGSDLFINSGGPTNSSTCRADTSGPSGEWVHVIIRVDGSNTYFRLNGANTSTVVTAGSDTGAFFNDVFSVDTLKIGQLDRSGSAYDLDGDQFQIAFLTMYSRYISDYECALLENEY